MMEEVYRPGEDSYLLQRYVMEMVCGTALDMGTGSGVQAVTAALKPSVSHILAVDINPAALIEAEKRAISYKVVDKIDFQLSDLFSSIESSFDWILFNTPYLPSEGDADELSWVGGEAGGEIIRQFLGDASAHLTEGGSILMIYSSQSGLSVEDFSGYEVDLLEETGLFFEKIYCVRLIPS